ncbi:hypothetical protein ACH518_09695 [Methylomonas sp. HW2-6]|uniref:hypothetical protein n=1 Tax=Methylomonas sp. HW2-6 TaxID=3376687 RepID=UPI0040434BC1
MHKIDGAGNIGGMFVWEDPDLNRPPTELTAEWLNAVQQELINVILWAELDLNKSDNSQLLQALQAKFASIDPGGDYAAKAAVQSDDYKIADATGTANAIVGAFFPAITSLASAHGTSLFVRASAANTIAAPTFTPNTGTVPAKAIVKGNNLPLAPGDIAGAGYWMELRYDSAFDKWVLANPARGLSSASAAVSGSAKNLRSSATGASVSISISADEIVVKNTLGESVTLENVAVVLNTASVGVNGLDSGILAANTWYDRYIIYDGATPAALMCVSGNSPVLPAGYAFKAYVGAFRTDNTVNKFPVGFTQAGGMFQPRVSASGNLPALPVMANGVVGSGMSSATPTWGAVAVRGVVAPPNATAVHFVVGCFTNTSGAQFIVAPNNQYGGLGLTNSPAPIASNGYGFANFQGRLLLESNNIFYVSGSASLTMYCFGWEEAL